MAYLRESCVACSLPDWEVIEQNVYLDDAVDSAAKFNLVVVYF